MLTPITPTQAAAPSAPGPSTSAGRSQTVAAGPSAAATGAGAGPDAPDSPAAPRAAAAAASPGQAALPVSSQTLPQAGWPLPDQLAPAGAQPTAQSTAQPASSPLQAEGVKPRVNAPSVVQDDLARAAARRAKQAAAPAARPTLPDGSPLRPMPAASPAAQPTSPEVSPPRPLQAALPAASPETQTLQQGWVAVTPQQRSLPDQHSQTAPRRVTTEGLHDHSALSGAPQVGFLDRGRTSLPYSASSPHALPGSPTAPRLFWLGEIKCCISMQILLLLGWQVCLGAACTVLWAAQQQQGSPVQSPHQALLQHCNILGPCLRVCKQPTCISGQPFTSVLQVARPLCPTKPAHPPSCNPCTLPDQLHMLMSMLPVCMLTYVLQAHKAASHTACVLTAQHMCSALHPRDQASESSGPLTRALPI